MCFEYGFHFFLFLAGQTRFNIGDNPHEVRVIDVVAVIDVPLLFNFVPVEAMFGDHEFRRRRKTHMLIFEGGVFSHLKEKVKRVCLIFEAFGE